MARDFGSNPGLCRSSGRGSWELRGQERGPFCRKDGEREAHQVCRSQGSGEGWEQLAVALDLPQEEARSH